MSLTRMTKTDDLPSLLTVKEAAVYLGISPATVYTMVHNGNIMNKQFGRCIRIPREAFALMSEKSKSE